jgi:hypothetical protein
MAILNYTRKGMGGVGALTAQTSVYGTTWFDSHTSATAGRITLLMNESNSINASTVTLTNGALFNSVGGLYMPTIGQTCTFEMPYYCIGHTSIANTALVMAGGTVANYRFEFSIDKNDGAGFSTLSASTYTAATLATALSALTGISAILGFKLRLKVSTTTTNATAITSMYLTTVSSTTTQAYQYPLDLYTLSLTGLISGSDVIIYQAGTETVRQTSDAISGSSQTYIYSATENIDIGVFCQGYIPLFIRNYSLTTSNATLPIAQVVDRAYLI